MKATFRTDIPEHGMGDFGDDLSVQSCNNLTRTSTINVNVNVNVFVNVVPRTLRSNMANMQDEMQFMNLCEVSLCDDSAKIVSELLVVGHLGAHIIQRELVDLSTLSPFVSLYFVTHVACALNDRLFLAQ